MHLIFISYRRDDSQGEALKLFDDLTAALGKDTVFLDIEMKPGRDFRDSIHKNLSSCTAFLCLIGDNWLIEKDSSGQRRLDDPEDFVRLEIATALKRGIPVIPVLVKGAAMPKPEQLPDDIKDLAFRQCFELRHAGWKSDLKVLIGFLNPPSPILELLKLLIGYARKNPVMCLAILLLIAFSRTRGLAHAPTGWTLFVGLIIGTLARLFARGKHRLGLMTTVLLGVCGSFLATCLGWVLGWSHPGGWTEFFLSILGAMLLLTGYRIAVKKHLAFMSEFSPSPPKPSQLTEPQPSGSAARY